MEKNREFICAVTRENFFKSIGVGGDGISEYDGDKFFCYSDVGPAGILREFNGDTIKAIYNNIVFKPRNLLEDDNRFLQIVPYNVFFCGVHGDKGLINRDDLIFVCTRGNRVGEQRLSGKCSIGIGGHVEICDLDGHLSDGIHVPGAGIADYGARKFLSLLKANMVREIREETSLTPQYYRLVETPGWIFDWSNDVGNVHLGMLNFIRVNDVSRIFLSKEHKRGLFYDMGLLMDSLHKFNFETWSEVTLSFLKKRLYMEGSQ